MRVVTVNCRLLSANFILIFLRILLFGNCVDHESHDIERFPVLFEKMEDAYSSDEWELCVKHGIQVVSDFKSHLETILSCRESCNSRKGSLHTRTDAFLSSYTSSLEKITCIQRCKPRVVREDFFAQRIIEREPYDYMQLCYYKVWQLYPSASYDQFVLAVLNV